MFDRFTVHARKCMGHSRQVAQEFCHDYIGSEHLLLALIRTEGTAAQALADVGVTLDAVREGVLAHLDHQRTRRPAPSLLRRWTNWRR